MRNRARAFIATAVLFASTALSFVAAQVTPRMKTTPEPGASEAKSLEVPSGSFVAPGKSPDLILLYTGDVIGYLDTCGCKHNPAGGLARRAWIGNQIDAAFPKAPHLLLDSGNFSDNPTIDGDLRTKGLLEGMVKLGYKVVNVGERELALGYDEFTKKIEGSPLTFVSANVIRQDTQATVFKPYTIVEVKQEGGKKPIRVGVTGVTRYSPVWLKAGPDGSNLGLARPIDKVRPIVEELRKKTDLVVVLTAMSKGDAQQLANEVRGIDFILGAYGGVYNYNEETVGGARVFYSGNQGKRLGETRVYLDAGGKIATTTSYMHFLTEAYGKDPAMAAFVDRLTAEINKVKGVLQAPAAPQAGQPASAGGGNPSGTN